MTITDDDVKTRGQKDKLEEINAIAQEQADTGLAEKEEKEVKEEEEEEGGKDTSEEVKDTSEEMEGQDNAESCDPPPKMVRDGTMVVTAKVWCVGLGTGACDKGDKSV